MENMGIVCLMVVSYEIGSKIKLIIFQP
jgi:hypothetical protein